MKSKLEANNPQRSIGVLLHPVVSCYVCQSPNAKHELREMSPRCGHFLCDECKRKEDDASAAFRWLCS